MCQGTGVKGDMRAVQAEEAAWAWLETLPALVSVAKWLEQQLAHQSVVCLPHSALPSPVPGWLEWGSPLTQDGSDSISR